MGVIKLILHKNCCGEKKNNNKFFIKFIQYGEYLDAVFFI